MHSIHTEQIDSTARTALTGDLIQSQRTVEQGFVCVERYIHQVHVNLCQEMFRAVECNYLLKHTQQQLFALNTDKTCHQLMKYD